MYSLCCILYQIINRDRLLLYTAIVTPYSVAFFDVDTTGWKSADLVVDGLFLFDIILNFITAYYDSQEDLVINRYNFTPFKLL
jgi:hypothetical protein